MLAEWIPSTEQLTVHASSQVPHLVRQELAVALRLRVDQVRVVTPDVGGVFGGKTTAYVDEAMARLARRCWVAGSSGSRTAPRT